MCPIDFSRCSCLGHRVPGVEHIAPCCDEPHVDKLYLDDPLMACGLCRTTYTVDEFFGHVCVEKRIGI